jgi:molecular chaperone DnaK (HSP70)
MDIGIDLGTTFSVLAVKGKVDMVDGYPEGRYLDQFDVTIIPSPDGDLSLPSVVWIDPDDPENVLIGYDAKQKAEDGDAPLMFSKRAIGTASELNVSGHKLSARDAAACMLRYFKQCSEQALGKPVERVVATHPAYFEPQQILETKKACEAAGLSMEQPEQLMMEPAAAALAYLSTVEQDPISVMTYDLGGGTFDVTVLERRDGVISMKAFDGNALLGGYNFDKALVRWILEKVTQNGREIPFDSENAEHRSQRARLLMLAENIKIRLAEQRTDKTKVPVRAPDMLTDAEGRPVPVQLQITRAEFKELIRDDLESTFDCCRSALSKAELDLEGLNMILLVGGSTFGPWVVEGLQEAFPDARVEFEEQDLCVAAGAAIRAEMLPPQSRAAGFTMTLDVPTRTPLPTVDITGTVSADDGSVFDEQQRSVVSVSLIDGGGYTHTADSLDSDGVFAFTDIELDDEAPNSFKVSVINKEGIELITKVFEIQYDERQQSTDIFTVLPKPIFIKTGRGLVPIADEGVELPARITERFERLHDGDRMGIEVVVDGESIGEIEVMNIPPEAGRGSFVDVDLEITRHNEMRGHAAVLTTDDTEVARSKVKVVFPPTPLPDIADLWVRFEDLEDRRVDDAENAPDPSRRTILKGKGKKLSDKILTLLKDQPPDIQEIQQKLRAFDQLMNPPKVDMDPPRDSFVELVEKCRNAIRDLGDTPEAKSFSSRLEKIREDGEMAFAQKNKRQWTRANENIAKLYSRLDTTSDNDTPLPPTELLKDQFLQWVEQSRADLETKRGALTSRSDYQSRLRSRCDDIAGQLDAMERRIGKVNDDLPSQQGLAQLQMATRGISDIPRRIEMCESEVK